MEPAAAFPQQIIAKKRDGGELDREEIASFVRGAADGSWADYQLSALLMAITLRGMTPMETAALTELMMRSGVVADLKYVRRPKVDKHSTGGVGDKVSIHLAPMVAACGVAVPMISGRGLGHTGGTLDKLESIPGFRVGLGLSEYQEQVERIGVALAGQTPEFAPADRKLYALRDVTGTVESLPLICASIMSKKLAEGIDALVLDVKVGRGAFMPDQARALELARAMVAVGKAMGKRVTAVLTRMDEPLGRAVGNAVEVAESLACLRGRGPADLMEVTYALGVRMLRLARPELGEPEARRMLEERVEKGAALAIFRQIVAAQGGDARVVDEPDRLPCSRIQAPLPSPVQGVVQEVDARKVAEACLHLGAGRRRAEDRVDPAVGVTGLVKCGERVAAGQPLCTIHAASDAALGEARAHLADAIRLGTSPLAPRSLVMEVVD